MQTNFKKKTLAAIVAATVSATTGFSSGAMAQDNAEKGSGEFLETMVVVGEATNALITNEDLESYQANDLEDIFKLTPSVSVGGGASGITQKVYVRGLEDALINVTVDGSPQTSTLFHHIGRVTIDPDLLKEVEVQSGAGEATSGAGAIGGSIRFKTKDVNDLLDRGESFGGKVKVSSSSNDADQHSVTLFGRLSDNWGLMAYHNNINRNIAEDGDGNDLPGSEADQKLGFVKLSGDISDNQYFSLSYEKRDERTDLPKQPDWTPLEGAPLFEAEGERETYSVNYQLSGGDLLNLELAAYHTTSMFQRELWNWNAEITSYGFDLRNTSVLGIHRLTYGVDLREDQVDSGRQDASTQHSEEGRVFGVYVQAHSQVTDDLLLSYGARYDDYEFDKTKSEGSAVPLTGADSSDVSVNAGLEYSITDELKASIGYAEAVRGKEIGDGFTIDTSTVDPSLDPESVQNIEAAMEYSTGDFYAKVAVFRSEIDDVIFDQRSGPVFYENIGTIKTDGFEVELAYRWTEELEMKLGFSSIDAILDPKNGLYAVDHGDIELEAYEYNGLGNNRGDTWNLSFNYTPAANLKFGWNITHVQDRNNIEVLQRAQALGWTPITGEIDKPAYTTHDLFAEWSPVNNLKLNLAVINAFDRDYRDHSSVGDYTHIFPTVSGYKEPGRDVRLSVTYDF